MVGNNVYAGILTLLTGSIGDIISRITWYNCSVSNIWTLLFAMPPLSIVTSIMYFLNKIEPGTESCSSSFDMFLVILPITIIVVAYLLGYVMDESSDVLLYIIQLIISFVIFTAIRYYKNIQICNKTYPNLPAKHEQYIKDALMKAGIGVGAAAFISIIAPYLSHIPIVGAAFKMIDYMGYIDGLQLAVVLTIFDVLYNLYGNLPNSQQAICM